MMANYLRLLCHIDVLGKMVQDGKYMDLKFVADYKYLVRTQTDSFKEAR
jgi:hypothetical protein